ncbi:hypothetical protein SteCoe_2595 [Stentor coeruleus]|uniref:EGF-like domain-containing protein n=1 Tax=Stentor coeruleus TaxID=5963 RepID=A0A1R2CZ18_9CILI|nr:hypothetical protein SteCoe_2595 [Stentor coeruleus]
MFWLLLTFIVSTAVDVSYLNFSSTTNPTNATIDLTISSVSDQSYSIEFWMRPLFKSTDKGTFTALTVSNDWKATYALLDSSLTIGSTSNGDYCQINYVTPNSWNHIVIAYNKESSRTMNCYVNSTLKYTMPNANTVAKSPDTVKIGGAFYGNLFDLRVWLGKCLTKYEIEKNFTFYLTSPYPSNLKKYYRLIEETTSSSSLKEYIAGTVKTFSTSTFINIWKKESPGSLILCAPGYYNSSNECVKCPSNYAFCKGTQSYLCYNTTRSFIDFSLSTFTDIVKLTHYTNVLTIEFWFYPFQWDTNLELLSIPNLITIKQRGSDSIVSFYDGASNEVHNFTSNINQWVHVAWVYQSNNKAILYVNNTSKTVSWTNSTPSTSLYLGGSNLSSRFKGRISDLRMWTSERSSYNLLANLYTNYTTSSIPSDMIQFCPLSENSKTLNCKIKTYTYTTLASSWRNQDCTTENCLFLCPFKNYFSSDQGECKSCDSSCQACSGPSSTECTVCLSTDFTIPGQNSCYASCPSGYVAQGTICQTSCNTGYYNNSNICTLCNSLCLSCKNSTYCTSCIAGYSIYPLVQDGVCIQDCTTGYFLDSTLKCSICNTSCTTCYGTTNNCISCPTSQFLYNGVCYKSCPLYTYNITTNCYNCHESCYNCTGSNSNECITCKPTYVYTDNVGICYEKCPSYYNETSKKCLSACPVSTYPQANNSCNFCDPSCLECTGPSSNECSKCPAKFFNNTCLAICPSNTYDNSSICELCDTSCLTCSSISTNCTTCPSSKYLYNSACITTCPSGSYPLDAYMTCVTSCPKGYYLINNTCQPCDNNCTTCITTSSTCTSCPIDKYLYNQTCTTKCPDGYYPKDTECALCGPNCKTCKDYNFCLTCNDTKLYIDASVGTCNTTCNVTTYTQGQSCVSSCSLSYFPVENPKFCQNCPIGCVNCTSLSVCQTCTTGYYVLGTTCVDTCPSNNFYPNTTGMYCGTCDTSCLQCNGNTLANCTVCSGGKVVYVNETGIGSCLTACPDGTYLSGTMCKSCMSNCKTCNNNSTCTSCKKSFYLRTTKTCETTCGYGDLMNTVNSTCIPYKSISPTGSLSMASFAMIQLTYNVPIVKGSGNITVFSVFNGTYTPVQTYYIIYGSTVNLGSALGTSVTTASYSYDTDYTIEYSGGAVSSAYGLNVLIPRGLWNFYINPYIFDPLVVIINSGTRGLEVKKGEDLVLDASQSYDPSSGYSKSVLYGSWACYDFSSSYAQYSRGYGTSWADYISTVSTNDPSQSLCSFWNYETPPDNSTLTLSSLTENDMVLRFTYTLTDDIDRTTSKDIFIRVVPASFNPVSLDNTPVYRVNTDKELQLFVSNPIISSNSQYKWSCTSSGKTPTFSTPLSSWILVIAANSMSQNSDYTFSLTYSDVSTKSSAIATISTNSAPTSGTLNIDKSSGTALIDTFTAQMIGWTDIDLPLTYSFNLALNTSSITYLMSGLQSSTILSIFLPGGFLTITGSCYDSLGARSQAKKTIEVSYLHNIQKLLEEYDSLQTSVDESNVFIMIAMIQGFAVEFNWTYPDNKIIFTKKLALMTMLGQAKTVADNLYTRDTDINALYIYSGILGCIEMLIREPVNNDIMTLAVQIFMSIDYSRLEMKQKIYPISNSTISATSPQYVFHDDDIENLAYTMVNIVDYVSSFVNSSLFVSQIPDMIVLTKEVLALGSVITQIEKTLNHDNMDVITSKALVSSIENTNFTISEGVSIKIPQSLSLTNTSSVSFLAAYIQTNPFTSSSIVLDSYILVELQDLDTGSILSLSDLKEPILLSFNITRITLDKMRSQASSLQGSSVKISPECSFWDLDSKSWATKGCSLYNIGDIYGYFEYIDIPESFTIKCSCNHLSQFSVSFTSTQIADQISYIINDDNNLVFKSDNWEATVVLYLMISGLITLFVTMSLAYYWDNYNPGLSLPSVETEKTFRYWDPNKVEAVLAQLEKEFIRQLTDSGKSEKKDTTAAISKILNSGLVSKLVQENKNTHNEDFEEHPRTTRPHAVETLMGQDSDDETMESRAKKHLKKAINDPRSMQTIVSEPKPRQNTLRRDLENTIAQLKLHSSHLESNNQVKTQVDLFLEKYDESEKLPEVLKTKLKLEHRRLKSSGLKALGINQNEFCALKTTKTGNIVPDCNSLTGGKYSQKIVDEVRRFYGSLKMSYWGLFWMYVKKEHKYISLLFNLHIEYSKKQMLILISVYWYLQLLFCQIYIAYLNWEWDKNYNQSGLCIWGCNYEAQMLAGVICSILPWPAYYVCKYLFARNMIEFSAPHSEKAQAYQNKHCRELVGIILSFLIILLSVIGICVISAKDPFSVGTAEEFLYCYMASMIWSIFIGEFIATVFKAWLVWMASSKNFKKDQNLEPSCWARFAKATLTLFPCLLPTEL